MTDVLATDVLTAERRTCLILNRFTDDYCRYAAYLEDYDGQLWLVSTGLEGMPGFRPSDFARADTVARLDEAAVREVLDAHPELAATVRHVVSVSEYDLELGARVRERLGATGYSVEYIRRFRDKVYSKRFVGAGGVRVPACRTLDVNTTIEDIEAQWHYPLVVKPVAGAASQGVAVCRSRAEVVCKLATLDRSCTWEIESFVEGDVYHCDGFVEGGDVRFLSPSRYVGTCARFNDGHMLGSVSVQGTDEHDILLVGAHASLAALGLHDGVFHLEGFIVDDEFVFLEVGHRPGGAEVLPVVHRHTGVDLMAVAVRLSCGLSALPAGAAIRRSAESYGWMLLPAVGEVGNVVVGVAAAAILPKEIDVVRMAFPGLVVPEDPEYGFTGLTAHVRAPSPARAEAAIVDTARAVTITYAPSLMTC